MTETEDERGSDVEEVTKVASMSGGYVRRQPPKGEHGRRRPWGVAAMPKGEEEKDAACQRERDLLCMMELSDIHHERQREYYVQKGLQPPERAHRAWSNLHKGNLRNRVPVPSAWPHGGEDEGSRRVHRA